MSDLRLWTKGTFERALQKLKDSVFVRQPLITLQSDLPIGFGTASSLRAGPN
jgi:hypothetical protein